MVPLHKRLLGIRLDSKYRARISVTQNVFRRGFMTPICGLELDGCRATSDRFGCCAHCLDQLYDMQCVVFVTPLEYNVWTSQGVIHNNSQSKKTAYHCELLMLDMSEYSQAMRRIDVNNKANTPEKVQEVIDAVCSNAVIVQLPEE